MDVSTGVSIFRALLPEWEESSLEEVEVIYNFFTITIYRWRTWVAKIYYCPNEFVQEASIYHLLRNARVTGVLPVHVIDPERSVIIIPLGEEVDGPWTEEMALQAHQAMQNLHQLRILHRDIKPPNFLRYQGQMVLIDFDLSSPDFLLDSYSLMVEVGTFGFKAPGLLLNGSIEDQIPYTMYGAEIDAWNLACSTIFHHKLPNYSQFHVFPQDPEENLEKIRAQCTFFQEYIARIPPYKMVPLPLHKLLQVYEHAQMFDLSREYLQPTEMTLPCQIRVASFATNTFLTWEQSKTLVCGFLYGMEIPDCLKLYMQKIHLIIYSLTLYDLYQLKHPRLEDGEFLEILLSFPEGRYDTLDLVEQMHARVLERDYILSMV